MRVFKGSSPNTSDIMKCLMEVSTKREWLEKAVIVCSKEGFISFSKHMKNMTLGTINLSLPTDKPSEITIMGTKFLIMITENLESDEWVIS